jgi:hypothetical protein
MALPLLFASPFRISKKLRKILLMLPAQKDLKKWPELYILLPTDLNIATASWSSIFLQNLAKRNMILQSLSILFM